MQIKILQIISMFVLVSLWTDISPADAQQDQYFCSLWSNNDSTCSSSPVARYNNWAPTVTGAINACPLIIPYYRADCSKNNCWWKLTSSDGTISYSPCKQFTSVKLSCYFWSKNNNCSGSPDGTYDTQTTDPGEANTWCLNKTQNVCKNGEDCSFETGSDDRRSLCGNLSEWGSQSNRLQVPSPHNPGFEQQRHRK